MITDRTACSSVNIQIYLPNDWKELQLQILEQQLFKIGITRDYINGVSIALVQKPDLFPLLIPPVLYRWTPH